MGTKTSNQLRFGGSVEECAECLIRTAQNLRTEEGISHDEEVSLYVIDAPLVHSTLSEFRKLIMEKANLVDIVQVDLKAGMPMPADLPKTEVTIGDEKITIGLERQAKG